jgi:acylphosphatase
VTPPVEQACRWLVSGRVQGVGYRWFTVQRARALDVAGWVSNLQDGRVEVVARGFPDQLAALEGALRLGPGGANVESVEKSDIPHHTVPDKAFSVR